MVLNSLYKFPLVTTTQLTIILLITAVVFAVFIGIAILKMYKLKAENRKLMDRNKFNSKSKEYTDFTEGHLYDS
ncbi:MAG: hypothetical protein HRU26_10015 [Psychroserpens sp.]|nr:hypothetical protein [Psychroserpens sp.]